ncbi:hypothetical protein Tco_1095566, partial [Tanacetum coccineum]
NRQTAHQENQTVPQEAIELSLALERSKVEPARKEEEQRLKDAALDAELEREFGDDQGSLEQPGCEKVDTPEKETDDDDDDTESDDDATRFVVEAKRPLIEEKQTTHTSASSTSPRFVIEAKRPLVEGHNFNSGHNWCATRSNIRNTFRCATTIVTQPGTAEEVPTKSSPTPTTATTPTPPTMTPNTKNQSSASNDCTSSKNKFNTTNEKTTHPQRKTAMIS